jgi:hypothetical protein
MKKSKRTLFDVSRIAHALSRALSLDLNRVAKQCPGNLPQALSLYIQNQKVDFLRKSEFDTGPGSLPTHEDRVAAAVDQFLQVSEHVVQTNLELSLLNNGWRQKRVADWTESDLLARDLSRMKFFCGQVLGDLNMESYFRACKSSSGVTLGLRFEGTDLEDKWRFPLTGTAETVNLFQLYLEWDVEFHAALLWFNKNSKAPMYKFVSESRTSGVQKTSKIARLIAVEPTLNMFFQQGLMTLMTERLRPFVDLETAQFLHHRLAWLGSLTRDISTYDMTSASDTVARVLVRETFSHSWYAELDRVAMKHTTAIRFDEKLYLSLPMFSTMGNATTFPVETLLFYSMLVTINSQYSSEYSCVPVEEWNTDRISTFGDDCILPAKLNSRFEWLVSKCGFLINVEKSHFCSEDSFRESCGVDYLSGHNIRSFYLSEPHNSNPTSVEAWTYNVVNGVFQKLIYNFGRFHYIYMCPSFLKVVRVVLKTYSNGIKYVPSYFPEDSGIRDFGDSRIRHTLYDCDVSPVYIDKHGTASFYSLRFEYAQERNPFKFLRYAVSLKTLSPNPWWSATSVPKYGVYTPAMLRTMALAIVRGSSQTSPRLSYYKRKKLVVKVGRMKNVTALNVDSFARRTTKRVGAYRTVGSLGWMSS